MKSVQRTIESRWFLRVTKTLRSGVNIINVLCAAFTHAGPESVNFLFRCQYHFTLLGSARVKASKKNDDEIDTWSSIPSAIVCSLASVLKMILNGRMKAKNKMKIFELSEKKLRELYHFLACFFYFNSGTNFCFEVTLLISRR